MIINRLFENNKFDRVTLPFSPFSTVQLVTVSPKFCLNYNNSQWKMSMNKKMAYTNQVAEQSYQSQDIRPESPEGGDVNDFVK